MVVLRCDATESRIGKKIATRLTTALSLTGANKHAPGDEMSLLPQ
jgi:hypothetical protein